MVFSSIWTVFLFFFLLLATRPFTVLAHELGHAIPALLYTNRQVTIYIGSYGDKQRSLVLNFGRLRAFLSWNIFQPEIGLCSHSAAKTFFQNLLIIIGGPIASLVFGLSLLLIVEKFEFSEMTSFVMYLLVVSSILDFFVNIYPSKNPIILQDGSTIYNDGFQLRRLLTTPNYPDSYFQAIDFINEKKYKRAANSLHQTIESGFEEKEIFILLAKVYEIDEQYEKAISVFNSLVSKHKLNSEEYLFLAETYFNLDDMKRTVLACNKAIHLQYQNTPAILLRGRAFLKQKNVSESVSNFNQLIQMKAAQTPTAYSFRGLANILGNDFESAKEDIQHALKLNPNNAFTYFHYGIYFYRKNNFQQALKYFNEAKKIEPKLKGIDPYIISSLEYLEK